ncbi:MAG: flagellar export protein FliJ [Phycisphaeraceae bacterium]|nr:flagellar export protein FliJ [Phycisphaeraceae bacterium]
MAGTNRRFIFSLEPVLEVRRERERSAMLRVAELERERLAAEERLRTMSAEADRARVELRECLAGPGREMAVRGVRMQAAALFSLHGRTHAGALTLAGVLKRLETARAELLKATTDRKAVERLRERRLEEWRTGVRRAEAKQVDEITTAASARAMAHGGTRAGAEVVR